jgi:hypothetical protein
MLLSFIPPFTLLLLVFRLMLLLVDAHLVLLLVAPRVVVGHFASLVDVHFTVLLVLTLHWYTSLFALVVIVRCSLALLLCSVSPCCYYLLNSLCCCCSPCVVPICLSLLLLALCCCYSPCFVVGCSSCCCWSLCIIGHCSFCDVGWYLLCIGIGHYSPWLLLFVAHLDWYYVRFAHVVIICQTTCVVVACRMLFLLAFCCYCLPCVVAPRLFLLLFALCCSSSPCVVIVCLVLSLLALCCYSSPWLLLLLLVVALCQNMANMIVPMTRFVVINVIKYYIYIYISI